MRGDGSGASQITFEVWRKLPISCLDFKTPPVQVRGMKSKQLANVLIKILGLSTLVSGIYGLTVGLLQLTQIGVFGRNMPFTSYLQMPASAIVHLVIGIYFIVKSRKLTEFLFKDEDE